MASVHAALHTSPQEIDSGASTMENEDIAYPCPVGERVYHDRKCSVKKMTFLEHLAAVLSLGLYTAWPYILFGLVVLSFFHRMVLVLTIMIFSTLLLPCPLFWEKFLTWELFTLWRRYFSFSYYLEEKLPTRKNYLFAEFPHGTFPMGPLLAATLIPNMFPGEKIYSLAADVLFKIPVYRHFMCLLGSQPADKKQFNALIAKASVAIVVGGIAEMFMQHETKEQVLLSRRKGFVRLALTNGVDIIPVFHFGNSRIMSIGPKSLKSLIDFCRRMRMSFGIMVGRWGLPIPKPHPIYMVVGRAVKVTEKIPADHPDFAKAVDELHGRVVDELKRLYTEHRVEFGWGDRPLEIV